MIIALIGLFVSVAGAITATVTWLVTRQPKVVIPREPVTTSTQPISVFVAGQFDGTAKVKINDESE
ncbi:MAG TPA: hypothetical protein VN081_01670 [Dongiaceae bacterium]|nr:hypothetical protein [Dongiaceae bacterium]